MASKHREKSLSDKHKIPISVCLWGLGCKKGKRAFMNILHPVRKKYKKSKELSSWGSGRHSINVSCYHSVLLGDEMLLLTHRLPMYWRKDYRLLFFHSTSPFPATKDHSPRAGPKHQNSGELTTLRGSPFYQKNDFRVSGGVRPLILLTMALSSLQAHSS